MKAILIDLNPILQRLNKREGVALNPPLVEGWVARSYGTRWNVKCVGLRSLQAFGAPGGSAFEYLALSQSLDTLGYDLISALPPPTDFKCDDSPMLTYLNSDNFLVIGDPNEVNRYRRHPAD